MPPIQRAIGPLAPVAPRDEFAAGLRSWHNPSFLAPLGHLVSAEAPAGVIHRLIEPAAAPKAHPAGVVLSFAGIASQPPSRGNVVQRMLAAFSAGAGGEVPGDASPPGPSPQDAPPPAEPPPVAPAPGPVPAVPVQRTAAPTPTPLTHAPPPPLPLLELPALPAEQREPSIAPVETPEPAQVGTPPPTDPGDTIEVPTLGVESPPPAAELRGTDGDSGSGSVDTAGLAPPSRTPSPPEQHGRSAPSSASVSRTVAVPPTPGTAITSPVQRAVQPQPPARPSAQTEGHAAESTPSKGADPGGTVAPLVGQSEGVSVQRGAIPSERQKRAAESASPPSAEVPGEQGRPRRLGLGAPLTPDVPTLQRSHGPPVVPPPATAPTLASEPAKGSSTDSPAWTLDEHLVQRLPASAPATADQAEDASSSGIGSAAPLVSALPVLPVVLPDAANSSTNGAARAAPPPLASSLPVVARLVGDRTPPLLTVPTPLGNGTRPAIRSFDNARVPASTVQRVDASSAADLPATVASVSAVQPGAAAARDPVRLSPAQPVVQTAPPELAPPQTVPPEPAPPSVLPVPDASDSPAGGPPDPSQPAPPPATAPGGTAPGGTPPVGAGVAGAAGTGTPDELVKKLFDPLLRRLKTELRLDRERRGMLTDLRH